MPAFALRAPDLPFPSYLTPLPMTLFPALAWEMASPNRARLPRPQGDAAPGDP